MPHALYSVPSEIPEDREYMQFIASCGRLRLSRVPSDLNVLRSVMEMIRIHEKGQNKKRGAKLTKPRTLLKLAELSLKRGDA